MSQQYQKLLKTFNVCSVTKTQKSAPAGRKPSHTLNVYMVYEYMKSNNITQHCHDGKKL